MRNALVALGALVLLLPPATARAEPAGDVLEAKGCLTCHSVDGGRRQGPTFAGLSGRVRRVVVDGVTRELVADRAYLRRAIVAPDQEVVEGYAAGSMPRLSLTPAELDAAVEQIEAKAQVAPLPPPDPAGLWPLALCAAAFVGLHLGLSSGAVRSRLVRALGEGGFGAVYSLLVAAALGGMGWFFRRVPYVELWSAPRWARWIPVAGMPLVVFLLVAGFSTRNPTAAGQDKGSPPEPTGIVRVTRHPGLWGFALWGLLHIAPNGEAHSLIVFASIITLALAGMAHIDARRAAAQGESWAAFAAKTSVVPFVAIAQGRNQLKLGEIGWARALGAVLLYVAILHTHRLFIGVPATP